MTMTLTHDPMALKDAMERCLARQRKRQIQEARRRERTRKQLQLIVGREVQFIEGRAI